MQLRHFAFLLAFLLAFLTPSASAQLLPPTRTYDITVADGTADVIARLSDRSQNGLFAQPGEWILFYDDQTTDGGPALSNPASLAYDSDGTLYISDTTLDVVMRAFDADGDGRAQSSTSGEWGIFFDNSNASGVTFTSVLNIELDDDHVLWGVNSGTGAAPLDFVFRAEDLNLDGDAQDAGEITIVYDSTSGTTNIAVPFAIAIDPSNADLIVTDVNPDAIYRLHDFDLNGDFYGAGEVIAIYTGSHPTAPGLSNANRIRYAPDGTLYVNDASLDAILHLVDLDQNGSYDDANEATLFADQTGNSFGVPANQFDIQIDENGVIFACESSALDGIIRYEDLNNDGDANDVGETTIIYNNAVGPGSIALPRALALVPAPRIASTGGNTVLLGSLLVLELDGFAADDYLVLLGVQSLGGPVAAPPFGFIGFSPLPLILNSGTLDANGETALAYPVPSTGVIPSGTQVYFSAVIGKEPYRRYLTNDLLVTFQ